VTDNLVPPEAGTEDALIGLYLVICTTVVHGTPPGLRRHLPTGGCFGASRAHPCDIGSEVRLTWAQW